jgi:hypothetical protein
MSKVAIGTSGWTHDSSMWRSAYSILTTRDNDQKNAAPLDARRLIKMLG